MSIWFHCLASSPGPLPVKLKIQCWCHHQRGDRGLLGVTWLIIPYVSTVVGLPHVWKKECRDMSVVFVNILVLNLLYFNIETNIFTWWIHDEFVLRDTFSPHVWVGRMQVLVSDKHFCCHSKRKKIHFLTLIGSECSHVEGTRVLIVLCSDGTWPFCPIIQNIRKYCQMMKCHTWNVMMKWTIDQFPYQICGWHLLICC